MNLGVLITYNDMPLLKLAVKSLAPIVDEIVAVDGKFSDFPGKHDHSTDGTVEYLESAGVHVISAPGLTEVHKRNCYLVGNVGDWYLHLDADEEWTGPLHIPEADMGIVNLRRAVPKHVMARARLFRHVPGLHYEGKHYWLRDGKGRTFALIAKPGDHYSAAPLPANLIIHHGDERSPERHAAKRVYYKTLRKRESGIKEVT